MKFAKERGAAFDFTTPRTCASCGNNFSGRYCNHCGEEVFDHKEKSVRHAFSSLTHSVISWENRFTRTIKLVVLKPGQFSLNYMHGLRVPFIRPLALFLIVNLLYFLFPVFETFDAPLRTQMHFLPHEEIATKMVEKSIEENSTTLADFTVRYEQHSSSLARQLLILFAVLAAIPIALINYLNYFYFIDHVVVSLEYNSLLIFVTQLLLPWILMTLIGAFGMAGIDLNFLMNEIFFTLLAIVVCVILFYFFERRVYGQSKRSAWLKSFLMIAGLFIAMQVYRIVLFFIAILTL